MTPVIVEEEKKGRNHKRRRVLCILSVFCEAQAVQCDVGWLQGAAASELVVQPPDATF